MEMQSKTPGQSHKGKFTPRLLSHQDCLVHFNPTPFSLSGKSGLFVAQSNLIQTKKVNSGSPKNLALDLVKVNSGVVRMHM